MRQQREFDQRENIRMKPMRTVGKVTGPFQLEREQPVISQAEKARRVKEFERYLEQDGVYEPDLKPTQGGQGFRRGGMRGRGRDHRQVPEPRRLQRDGQGSGRDLRPEIDYREGARRPAQGPQGKRQFGRQHFTRGGGRAGLFEGQRVGHM